MILTFRVLVSRTHGSDLPLEIIVRHRWEAIPKFDLRDLRVFVIL